MKHEPTSRSSRPHPAFDGHLEFAMHGPLTNENILERLQWAWEGAQLLHWARRAKDAEPDRKDRPEGDDGA